MLDSPLTLEELQIATATLPTCKAPGDYGLLVEVYKQYGERVLPFLLKVLNTAREHATFPYSMMNANIILLLKAGKDPTEPGSYRPISLLQRDIKILAKVLALPLNKVISMIIHPDQVLCPKNPQLSTTVGCFLT